MDNYCKNRQQYNNSMTFFIKIVVKFLNYSDVWVQEDTSLMQSKNFVGRNPYHKQTMQPTLSNFTWVKNKRYKSANFHLLGVRESQQFLVISQVMPSSNHHSYTFCCVKSKNFFA